VKVLDSPRWKWVAPWKNKTKLGQLFPSSFFRPRKITNNSWFVLPLRKPNMLPATTKHFDRAALHTVEQYQ